MLESHIHQFGSRVRGCRKAKLLGIDIRGGPEVERYGISKIDEIADREAITIKRTIEITEDRCKTAGTDEIISNGNRYACYSEKFGRTQWPDKVL